MKSNKKQPFDETYGGNPPENYERFFVPTISEPLAKDLISEADLREGDKVLDVACGTGIIARLALQHVGDSGHVTGLDINPGMVAVARSTIADKPIKWYEANAENMPLPNELFDTVICHLSLQFMEDKSAALQEMHRVLLPGGRLILNLPGQAGDVFTILEEAMEQNISTEAKEFVTQIFSLNDTDEIKQLIDGANFREPNIQAKKKTLLLPAPKDFLWQYVSSTPLAGILAEADPEANATLENEVVEQWQNFVEDEGFTYKQNIITASALK